MGVQYPWWELLVVCLASFGKSVCQADPRPTTLSDLDLIREMLPGVYDNKLQYGLDRLRNISETNRHQLMFVNVTNTDKYPMDNIAHFLFKANNPSFSAFSVTRMFIVRSFNVTGKVWFTVNNHPNAGGKNKINAPRFLACEMLWTRTDLDSFQNVRETPCQVSGEDDEYIVKTWLGLTNRMLTLKEEWISLPDRTVLPGPTTPYQFLKQNKGRHSHVI